MISHHASCLHDVAMTLNKHCLTFASEKFPCRWTWCDSEEDVYEMDQQSFEKSRWQSNGSLSGFTWWPKFADVVGVALKWETRKSQQITHKFLDYWKYFCTHSPAKKARCVSTCCKMSKLLLAFWSGKMSNWLTSGRMTSPTGIQNWHLG